MVNIYGHIYLFYRVPKTDLSHIPVILSFFLSFSFSTFKDLSSGQSIRFNSLSFLLHKTVFPDHLELLRPKYVDDISSSPYYTTIVPSSLPRESLSSTSSRSRDIPVFVFKRKLLIFSQMYFTLNFICSMVFFFGH